jgi:hypothetical protein
MMIKPRWKDLTFFNINLMKLIILHSEYFSKFETDFADGFHDMIFSMIICYSFFRIIIFIEKIDVNLNLFQCRK